MADFIEAGADQELDEKMRQQSEYKQQESASNISIEQDRQHHEICQHEQCNHPPDRKDLCLEEGHIPAGRRRRVNHDRAIVGWTGCLGKAL